MTAEKVNRLWLIGTGILIAIIIASSLTIWAHKGNGQTISVLPSRPSNLPVDVYIDGAVVSPGIYPLKTGDSIESLIQASGGINGVADLSRVDLFIPETGSSTPGPQKININRAEAWLLEALPEIGTSRAQDIVEFRQQHGLFRSIDEIMAVPGVSQTTFDKIKNLITIAD